jgi:ribosomal protein S18 acetylase RimI-like enzyme
MKLQSMTKKQMMFVKAGVDDLSKYGESHVFNWGSYHEYDFVMFDDDPAGFIAYYHAEGGSIFVSSIYVKEKYRRKGIASALMKKLPSNTKIILGAHPDNMASKSFFDSIGFKDVAIMKEGYIE